MCVLTLQLKGSFVWGRKTFLDDCMLEWTTHTTEARLYCSLPPTICRWLHVWRGRRWPTFSQRHRHKHSSHTHPNSAKHDTSTPPHQHRCYSHEKSVLERALFQATKSKTPINKIHFPLCLLLRSITLPSNGRLTRSNLETWNHKWKIDNQYTFTC